MRWHGRQPSVLVLNTACGKMPWLARSLGVPGGQPCVVENGHFSVPKTGRKWPAARQENNCMAVPTWGAGTHGLAALTGASSAITAMLRAAATQTSWTLQHSEPQHAKCVTHLSLQNQGSADSTPCLHTSRLRTPLTKATHPQAPQMSMS